MCSLATRSRLLLKSVSGPGNFFSYYVDSFLNPQVLFNSADGISTNDMTTVQGGGDAHLNWAFTQPGDYTVVLEVSGTLVAGNQVTSSGPVTFTFSVGAGRRFSTPATPTWPLITRPMPTPGTCMSGRTRWKKATMPTM